MKIIEITGKNYCGNWDKTRIACRGLIIKDNEILMSYETVTDQWMIPGGGLEENESEIDCLKREMGEETGILIKTLDCVLEIDEYYENFKWVNKYYICEEIGETKKNLTDREIEVGMEPRWTKIDEIINIFSKYNSYENIDEMRRGMYLREYKALTEILGDIVFTNKK